MINIKYQDQNDKTKRKPTIWCDAIDKQEQFYIDNPEEKGYPWSECGIRNQLEIKELKLINAGLIKRIEALEVSYGNPDV